MWGSPLLYERLTWPEVRRAASEERVCLVPVATLEDHGPHLPIDTDLRITAEVCRLTAEAAPDEIVLLPPIPHGYSPHHMDFPGPITIGWLAEATSLRTALGLVVLLALVIAVSARSGLASQRSRPGGQSG